MRRKNLTKISMAVLATLTAVTFTACGSNASTSNSIAANIETASDIEDTESPSEEATIIEADNSTDKVTENIVSDDTVSEDAVSEDAVSEDAVSESTEASTDSATDEISAATASYSKPGLPRADLEGSQAPNFTEGEAPAFEEGTAPDFANGQAPDFNSNTANQPSTTVSSNNTAATEKTTAATTDVFSNRDLKQTADLSEATYITVSSGNDITITEEGVYVLSGTATDVTVYVETADEDDAKVQLVLDGVSITNTDSPAIYVKNADKVFVTTTEGSSNTLKVTGTYTADGDTNLDAVIFSKDDLVLNGLGTLTVVSSNGNGITCKDDLKVTGGTYNITASGHGLEANDSISIAAGNFMVKSGKDGIHCENDDDLTLGSIYIENGTFDITASGDGIQCITTLTIDGGTIKISAVEGLEGTYVIINDGMVSISASDDGINATSKSTAYTVCIEINGGNINISMGQGDTDAIDSNGNLYIGGGTINITAQSPFDYDGTGVLNGGTIYVNGSQVTTLTNQMMGGGMMGGFGGQGGFGERGDFGGRDGFGDRGGF